MNVEPFRVRRNERIISSSRIIGEWTEKSFKSDEYVIKHHLIGYIAPGTQAHLGNENTTLLPKTLLIITQVTYEFCNACLGFN